MQRIWDEETTAGSRLLRAETLRRLGGAGTIVRAHVDDALTGMPDAERDAASEALRFLVTSGGRKIALSTTELREFTDVPAGAAGVGARAARAAPDPAARRRVGAGRRRSGGSCTTTCSRRRCSTGAVATRTSDDGVRPSGGWRRPATARGSSRSATAASPRR